MGGQTGLYGMGREDGIAPRHRLALAGLWELGSGLLVWLIGRFVALLSSCANATKASIPSTRNNRQTGDLIDLLESTHVAERPAVRL